MQGESCFQFGNVSGYILSDCFVFLHQTLCVCMSLWGRKGRLWDLTFNTVIDYYWWQFSKQGHHLLLPDFQGTKRAKTRHLWVQKNHSAFRMGQGPGQELEIRWESCEHRKPSRALGSAHDRQFLEQDSKEVPPGCKITAQRTIIEPLSPWRKYLGGSIT